MFTLLHLCCLCEAPPPQRIGVRACVRACVCVLAELVCVRLFNPGARQMFAGCKSPQPTREQEDLRPFGDYGGGGARD